MWQAKSYFQWNFTVSGTLISRHWFCWFSPSTLAISLALCLCASWASSLGLSPPRWTFDLQGFPLISESVGETSLMNGKWRCWQVGGSRCQATPPAPNHHHHHTVIDMWDSVRHVGRSEVIDPTPSHLGPHAVATLWPTNGPAGVELGFNSYQCFLSPLIKCENAVQLR